MPHVAIDQVLLRVERSNIISFPPGQSASAEHQLWGKLDDASSALGEWSYTSR